MKTSTQAGKTQRIIVALLEHGNAEKAATALGISVATVSRWLRNPEFEAQYRAARHEAFSRSMGRLQQSVHLAISTLIRTMRDQNAPPASRIRAADAVLTYGGTGALEDLQARVDVLEQARKDIPQDSRTPSALLDAGQPNPCKASTAGKADRIVLALLEHGTPAKAAAALGISAATVRRWSAKPEFEEQYCKARREAFSRSMARLQHAADTAVSTLLRVLVDKQGSFASKVQAAACILKHAHAFVLEDLQTRIDRLEQTHEEPGN